MGCSPRSDYHGFVSRSCTDCRRTGASNRALHLFDCPEYNPILVCRSHRLPLPLLLDSKGPKDPFYFPYQANSLPITPREHLVFSCLAVWLCQSRSYRLPDLHTGEILQASSCHVPPLDYLPEEISII